MSGPSAASQSSRKLDADPLAEAVDQLRRELAELKQFFSISENRISMSCGSASIDLSRHGYVSIKGETVKVFGADKVDVQAGGALTVKGSKNNQN